MRYHRFFVCFISFEFTLKGVINQNNTSAGGPLKASDGILSANMNFNANKMHGVIHAIVISMSLLLTIFDRCRQKSTRVSCTLLRCSVMRISRTHPKNIIFPFTI